jgi:hypothetical protein
VRALRGTFDEEILVIRRSNRMMYQTPVAKVRREQSAARRSEPQACERLSSRLPQHEVCQNSSTLRSTNMHEDCSYKACASKLEIRNSKYETNSKAQYQISKHEQLSRLGISAFFLLLLNLFRISCFGFRISHSRYASSPCVTFMNRSSRSRFSSLSPMSGRSFCTTSLTSS